MSSLKEGAKIALWVITILAVTAIALIGGYHAVINYVDKRIEDKINDQRFINKMAQNCPSRRFLMKMTASWRTWEQ